MCARVVGAVNSDIGQFVSLIVPHCGSVQAFFDTVAAEVPATAAKRIMLVLDNSGWHKTQRLHCHHIEPLSLPPSSPDINPIKRLWQNPKSHSLVGYLKRLVGILRQDLSFYP